MATHISRRRLFPLLATTIGGFTVWASGAHTETTGTARRPGVDATRTLMPPGAPGKHYTPVMTPNGWTLPYKIVDGVKVFHLIAEPVRHAFAPGLVGDCWGYNGTTPGPTIEAVGGSRLRR